MPDLCLCNDQNPANSMQAVVSSGLQVRGGLLIRRSPTNVNSVTLLVPDTVSHACSHCEPSKFAAKHWIIDYGVRNCVTQ